MGEDHSVPLNDARMASLEQRAIDARHAGNFEQAAVLFAEAADHADDLQTQLNLQIRQACCLLAVERHEEASALAELVAQQARAEHFMLELVDALGVIVDHYTRSDRLAEAAQVLSEAAYILDQLPNDSASYLVLQNMAVTYTHCGFVEAALELYDRALRLAKTDLDRQFTYANMAAAYHYAAQQEPDDEARTRLIHDGLYAATAALDPEGGGEAMAMASALAHRSMMLAEIGHFDAALEDAHTAYGTALEAGMREEQIIAMCGEAIALWGSTHDASVLALVDDTMALAHAFRVTDYLGPLRRVEVDALWSLQRFDAARAALERNLGDSARRLHDERGARWAHVRLGVEHLKVAAMSVSDPLTGLPNRRHLSALLPEVLNDNSPVCVGVIDLDGFKHVNDEYGYLQGDGVLQEVAGMLERVCRRGDSVVRLGGDEFVMVLRATSPGDARAVFERVRLMIAKRTWQGVPDTVRLTASVGVAVGSGSFDSSRVLAEAATALQQAKRDGRDRIAFR
jgi:diguanylate cyclase (GGDEF)-like protein